VIASMKAITVDSLSSSKFGSARLTSQTALITAEMIMAWTIEVSPTRPLVEPRNVFDVGNYLQAGPDPTAPHLALSVMNHLNATTPQDESPRLLCACG
jgi:hypothetical protein